MDLLKKAQSIKSKSIANIILIVVILILIFLLLFLMQYSLNIEMNDEYIDQNISFPEERMSMFIMIAIAMILFVIGIVALVLEIYCIVMIFSTNWKNDKLESSKVLWGILALIVLGPIASLVFSSKAKKILSSKENEQSN